MNEANLDHLLQVTPSRANWGPTGPAIGRDRLPAFDNHLAQATTPRAPAEPQRPTSAPPSTSASPSQHVTSNGETDRSTPEENDSADVAVPAPTPETDDHDNNRTATETHKNSATAEQAATEADSKDTVAEQSDDESQRDAETNDGVVEQVTELTAATNTVVTAVVLHLPFESATDDTAAPSSESESVEPDAKILPLTHQRQSGKDSQPVKAANEIAVVEAALPAEVTSAVVDAIPATPTTPIEATTNISPGIALQAAETTVHSTPRNVKTDRTTSTSKRQQTPDRETTSTNDHSGGVQGEDAPTTNAPQPTERPTKRVEITVDELHESKSARPVTGRNTLRPETSKNAGNAPLATAINSANQTAAAQETAKSDASDESPRPVAPTVSRSDALLHPLARLHRGGVLVSRSHHDANAEEHPPVDPARFVSRVAKAFQAAQERGGVLQLRLSPPELGSLRLELLVQDGVLAAKLEAETPAARRALLEHLPALRDRLAEQNIRIERFDVDVRQEGGGHSPSSSQHGRDQRPHNDSPHRQPPRQPSQSSEPTPAAPAAAGPITDSQINLVA